MLKIPTKTTTSKTKNSPKAILRKGYVRRLAPDPSGGYVASILEFPGCIAEGDSADEALQNLDRAAESWIEVSIGLGREIREPIDFDGYNGKIALRMPRTLHKQAAELAELEGCSLNQLLVSAISHFVGGKQIISKLETMLRPTNAVYFIAISGATMAPTSIRPLAIAEESDTPRFLSTTATPSEAKVLGSTVLQEA